MTDPTDRIRARVDGLADARRAGWYTRPVRDLAARLADAMLTAATDVDPRATLAVFDTTIGVAGACLDVAATVVGREPPLSAVTRESLLVRLVAALAERGILATRRGGAVMLDEKPGPVMSRWRWPLQISLYAEPAWDLTLAAPSGFTSVVALYSTFDTAGVDGIADMVAALTVGDLPDPFKA